MTARVLLATVFSALISLSTFAQVQEPGDDEALTATVLCYHIVESPQDERMHVSRETFRQHLDYLQMTGYNVISLKDLSDYVEGKRESIPRNAVVITIDDGWRSAYTEAWPELQKRGMPFTLFIYPKIIGNTTIALNWQQIKEMSDAGADIQSHSLSHPFLTRRRHQSLEDSEYGKWLYRELAESRRIIEKHTGKKVEFLAYPYGDYDTRVAAMAKKTGYSAALTCDFGRVKRGSNPLRMKRFVIDKRMDFAEFRRYMGADQMQLAEMKPAPGGEIDARTVVSARIPNYKSLDPSTVGMALLGLTSITPYSYDATTGAISLVVNDAIKNMKGRYHRAVVWATDTKTGKRVEASWAFKLPGEEEEEAKAAPKQPAPVVAASVIPVAPAAAGGAALALNVRPTTNTLQQAAPRK
jgi:peptidoglycan/xylan/chitin deacetylase (PgdA/CDA1 family)